MYNPKFRDAHEFICDAEIRVALEQAKILAADPAAVDKILTKAAEFKGLSHREAAVLLFADTAAGHERIYDLATSVKEKIYGKRIVMLRLSALGLTDVVSRGDHGHA